MRAYRCGSSSTVIGHTRSAGVSAIDLDARRCSIRSTWLTG
ncbi:MAG: hypothetical protein WB507_03415 [Solirubrobacterales bacterium]